ncbi:MAG: hypothetical protein F6K56_34065, partial [Moorea sp. SIO3G5]|nr:hypothetical protein [Moorena sp. SIO3G5]
FSDLSAVISERHCFCVVMGSRECGECGAGARGVWGDGEMGRWGDGEMGRWGDQLINGMILTVLWNGHLARGFF